MTNSNWARLRQVAIATADIEATGKAVRDAYGLGPGFADPELDDWGILDDTIPVADAYIELVGAAHDEHPMVGFLASRGGGAGYCLAVQHPDSRGATARAAELGVRQVVEIEDFQGAYIAQLNPADMGVLLELDGVADRDKWFWDDRDDNIPAPADAKISNIASVTIAVDDPDAMATKWRTIIGIDGDGPSVDLGEGRTADFVTIGDDGARGLIGVTVEAAEGASVEPMTIGSFTISVA